MDTANMLAVAALGVSVAGSSSLGLIWAIRQEGRINNVTSLFDAYKGEQETLDEVRESKADERHEDLCRRFDKLEAKLDKR